MKSLKILLLLAFSITGIQTTFSQVIFNKTPVDYSEKNYGPNMRHHLAFVISSQSYIDDDKTPSGTKYGKSLELSLGLRYKVKLTNILHFNTQLSYISSSFRFTDAHYIPGVGYLDNPNVLNSGFSSIDETYVKYQGMELAPSLRFRLSKGNNIGWFIDVGGFGQWTFAHKYQLIGDHVMYGEVDMTSSFDPDEYFNYGYFGRVGWNIVSLYFKHRLNQQYNNLYLQPYAVGIELMLNFNGQ